MASFSGAPNDVIDINGLKHNKSSRRSLFNIIMTGLSALCILIALVPLVLVLFYVLLKGG
jgi:ABC-type phosphate transport system permease subunit